MINVILYQRINEYISKQTAHQRSHRTSLNYLLRIRLWCIAEGGNRSISTQDAPRGVENDGFLPLPKHSGGRRDLDRLPLPTRSRARSGSWRHLSRNNAGAGRGYCVQAARAKYRRRLFFCLDEIKPSLADDRNRNTTIIPTRIAGKAKPSLRAATKMGNESHPAHLWVKGMQS